jgi:hypothetical protein
MMQIKDYRRDVNSVGLARPPPTENSWFCHCPRRYLTAASEPTLLSIVKQASKPAAQKHKEEQGAQPIPDVGHIEHTKDCTANFER